MIPGDDELSISADGVKQYKELSGCQLLHDSSTPSRGGCIFQLLGEKPVVIAERDEIHEETLTATLNQGGGEINDGSKGLTRTQKLRCGVSTRRSCADSVCITLRRKRRRNEASPTSTDAIP